MSIWTNRIRETATDYNWFADSQHGFRKKRGCQTACMDLKMKLGKYKLQNKKVVVIKLDINRAFDSVTWKGLQGMFENLKIPPHMQKIFWSSYEGTKVRIQYADREDSGFILEHGVKQGGPESPIIFSLFIDPILREMEDFVAYADDVNLITTEDKVQESIQKAKICFGHIGLVVSEEKTEIWKASEKKPLTILNMMVVGSKEEREAHIEEETEKVLTSARHKITLNYMERRQYANEVVNGKLSYKIFGAAPLEKDVILNVEKKTEHGYVNRIFPGISI